MAKQIKLTAASGYSSRDVREAKEEWSHRFLIVPETAAAAAAGVARRAGAHAPAVRAAHAT